MYPAGELNALAARKELLRLRIAQHRYRCVESVTQLAQPVALVDRAMALWRRMPSIVKLIGVPLGLFFGRKVAPRVGGFSTLLRYAPMAMRVARMVAARRTAPAAMP
jgi:hypothetical protein